MSRPSLRRWTSLPVEGERGSGWGACSVNSFIILSLAVRGLFRASRLRMLSWHGRAFTQGFDRFAGLQR